MEGVEAATEVRAARLGGTRRGSTSERADVLRRNRFGSGGFNKAKGGSIVDRLDDKSTVRWHFANQAAVLIERACFDLGHAASLS